MVFVRCCLWNTRKPAASERLHTLSPHITLYPIFCNKSRKNIHNFFSTVDFHSVFTIKGIYILSITYIALSDTAARVDPRAFYSALRAARFRARISAAVISAKNVAPFLCIFYPYAVDKTLIIGYNKLCEQACGKAGRALRNAVRFRDSPRCREDVARRHSYCHCGKPWEGRRRV